MAMILNAARHSQFSAATGLAKRSYSSLSVTRTSTMSPGLMPVALETMTWPSISGASHLERAMALLVSGCTSSTRT